MTPDDLVLVRRSWTELRRRRPAFHERLGAALATIADAATAGDRARRLIDAAGVLVDTLATPSDLALRARRIAADWPATTALPRLGVDGVAWRRAASEVCPGWSDAEDAAWHHAWLLLADVLAADSLAPFGGPVPGDGSPPPT